MHFLGHKPYQLSDKAKVRTKVANGPLEFKVRINNKIKKCFSLCTITLKTQGFIYDAAKWLVVREEIEDGDSS